MVDLIISFYRLQMVPESFGKALDGDGEVREQGSGMLHFSPTSGLPCSLAPYAAQSPSTQLSCPSPAHYPLQGGLHTKPGEAPASLKTRRMMAKAQSSGGISILRSLTSVRGKRESRESGGENLQLHNAGRCWLACHMHS